MRRGFLLAISLVAGMALAPLVGADHIRVMAVYQAGAGTGNEVTIHVDFNPTGNCCGGSFQWTTGETPSVSGSVQDGFSSGNYQGDVLTTQSGTLSDSRVFTWTRTSIPPGGGPDPGLVRIRITYAYLAAGPYNLTWQDCCVDSKGVAVVVAGGSAPVTRIAALDDALSTQAKDALDGAGIPLCTLASAGLCYELHDPTSFALANLVRTPLAAPGQDTGHFKVLYVAADTDATTLAALAARAQDIADFAAMGGGVVAYAQNAGLLTSTRWGWLPDGSSYTDSVSSGEDIHLTVKGQTHRSHLNQADATLSNWMVSRQNHFTAWPSHLGGTTASTDALSVDASSGEAISMAGPYNGRGCVFVSGQPADIIANSPGTSGAGITAKEGAMMLFRSSINFAIDC